MEKRVRTRRYICLKETFSTIVCLSGSLRFLLEYAEASLQETLKGNIVLSVGSPILTDDQLGLTEEQREVCREVHRDKIALSDEVFVIDVGGYVGVHTEADIRYAKSLDKKVRFWSMEKKAKMKENKYAEKVRKCTSDKGKDKEGT